MSKRISKSVILLTVLAAVALCRYCFGASIGANVITVTGPRVTLADLSPVVKVEGAIQTASQAAVVAVSPLPGKSRWLQRDEIIRRLSQYGIDPNKDTVVCPESIEIIRDATTITGEDIIAAGEALVREQYQVEAGQELIIEPQTNLRDFVLPVGEVDLVAEARNSSTNQSQAAATVSILVNGRIFRRIVVNYRVQLLGDMLVASHDLERHKRLGEVDVKLEKRDLFSCRGKIVDAAEGRRTTLRVRAGAPLTDGCTEPIPLVLKKHEVMVTVFCGSVIVNARAIALEDGAIGEMVRVRSPLSKEEFFVKVMGENRAEIRL